MLNEILEFKIKIDEFQDKFQNQEIIISNPYGKSNKGIIQFINLNNMICDIHFPEDETSVSFSITENGFVHVR